MAKTIGLPNIDVIFQGKANSAISRAGKGVACLLLEDTTGDNKVMAYKDLDSVDTDHYTSDNYKIIADVFKSDVSKLFVIKVDAEETLETVKGSINTEINWIAYATSKTSEQQALATFVKAQNKTRVKRLKALVYKVSTVDDMHVVNFINETVTLDGEEAMAGHKYVGRLLGVLAGCRLDQSITYKELPELAEVQEPSDVNAEIGKGNLVLINDDASVRIARGVNTLTTNDKNHTEDMKYITIVEGMDIIYEDIKKTFKDTYVGKFKNSYDNQVLFISSVNSYFRTLAADEVLDANYDNHASVNVEKQRETWIANGTVEAEGWNEKEVKNMTFRTNVFINAKVKFLNAIEDLEFIVEM